VYVLLLKGGRRLGSLIGYKDADETDLTRFSIDINESLGDTTRHPMKSRFPFIHASSPERL
jgi:hypothetical protein